MHRFCSLVVILVGCFVVNRLDAAEHSHVITNPYVAQQSAVPRFNALRPSSIPTPQTIAVSQVVQKRAEARLPADPLFALRTALQTSPARKPHCDDPVRQAAYHEKAALPTASSFTVEKSPPTPIQSNPLRTPESPTATSRFIGSSNPLR